MRTYPVARIDCQALTRNLQRVRALAPDSCVMAVIKANAYGHGASQVAAVLSESDAFAVARIDEAMELREAGIRHPLVVLEGAQCQQDIQIAANQAVSLVFHHYEQIRFLQHTHVETPLLTGWVMLETGMHRLGLPQDKARQALSQLHDCPKIDRVGIMSHFANADQPQHQLNKVQWQLTQRCALQGRYPISMANSAAILALPDSHAQWVRPGLMLYGISPFPDRTAMSIGLEPVMELVSRVMALQRLQTGDIVGYGGTWSAQHDSLIAIVDIGYGDGYSRQLSNQAKVVIRETLVPVVGRVSMDMIAVDVTDLPEIQIGDEVTLWGGPHLPVETVAQWAQTIAYELVCQVNSRVRREYING